jgi:membrane protease YdiL (CAAX protease family)
MDDSARVPGSDAEERAAARARRDVVVFVVVVASLVAVLDGLLIFSDPATPGLAFVVLAMMWTPGLVAIVLRLLGREGFADVSFRPFVGRGWRWYLLAWLLPLLVGGIAYGIGWFSGLAPPAAGAGLAGAAELLARTMTVAVPVSAVWVLGEEIGWRGFLLPRLVRGGAARPVLLTNVIWWTFHLPLILGGVYAAGPVPAVGALLFGVTVLGMGSVACWSRLATGSIWPSVLIHATWNSVIQDGFDVLTAGEGPRSVESLWVGESGILVAGVGVVVAVGVRAAMRLSSAAAVAHAR